MQIKNEPPLPHLDKTAAPALMQVYFEFIHLKQLYRQGWLRREISREHCESVAEHSLGVVFLAMTLAESHFPNLDLLKVFKMALLHDFGEIYAGDITPADRVSDHTKKALEQEAVHQIFDKLPGGDRYIAIWQEYEAGTSPEARFVKQIDRLEMGLQAVVYEYQHPRNLAEFMNSTSAALVEPDLVAFFDRVRAARRQTRP